MSHNKKTTKKAYYRSSAHVFFKANFSVPTKHFVYFKAFNETSILFQSNRFILSCFGYFFQRKVFVWHKKFKNHSLIYGFINYFFVRFDKKGSISLSKLKRKNIKLYEHPLFFNLECFKWNDFVAVIMSLPKKNPNTKFQRNPKANMKTFLVVFS